MYSTAMSEPDPGHRRLVDLNAGCDAVDLNVRVEAILSAASSLHSAGANLGPLSLAGRQACRTARDASGSADAYEALDELGGRLGGALDDLSTVCTNLAHVLAGCADAYTRADTTVVPDDTRRVGRPW